MKLPTKIELTKFATHVGEVRNRLNDKKLLSSEEWLSLNSIQNFLVDLTSHVDDLEAFKRVVFSMIREDVTRQAEHVAYNIMQSAISGEEP